MIAMGNPNTALGTQVKNRQLIGKDLKLLKLVIQERSGQALHSVGVKALADQSKRPQSIGRVVIA